MSDRFEQHPDSENVGAWLLGALDDAEARAFAEELSRSEELAAEVARLQPAADALLMGAEQHLAPPDLGARVLATVREEAQLRRAAEGIRAPAPARPEPPRRRWLGLHRGLAAGLATALLAVLVAGGILVSGGSDGPSATTVPAKVATPNGSGVLLIDGKKGGELALSGVPDPGAGRTYEVWLLPKGSTTPRRSTLFVTGADGSASVHLPADLSEVDRVLVTNEPAGGSDAPTTKPFVSVTV